MESQDESDIEKTGTAPPKVANLDFIELDLCNDSVVLDNTVGEMEQLAPNSQSEMNRLVETP